MSNIWRVRVRADAQYGVVRVAGVMFSKRGAVELNEADLREPYRSELAGSEYLEIEVVEVPPSPRPPSEGEERDQPRRRRAKEGAG